jgi:hypothetical protein
MFNRRTLATITAVAALTGGAAGGVTSTITTPEGANAAGNGITVHPTKADGTLGIKDPNKVSGPLFNTPQMRAEVAYSNVAKLVKTVAGIDARVTALSTRTAAVDERTARTDEKVDSLTSAIARNPEGRTLIGIVDDILLKTRAICADNVVTGPLGIGGGEDSRCR